MSADRSFTGPFYDGMFRNWGMRYEPPSVAINRQAVWEQMACERMITEMKRTTSTLSISYPPGWRAR